MKGQVKGFTLIEVMVAMVISMLVLTAGTASVVAIMKSTTGVTRRAKLDGESKMLMDFLVSKMQIVGGGAVRPWNAIWLENNCGLERGLPDCEGSDRLTVVYPNIEKECEIIGDDGSETLTIGDVLNPLTGATVCCLVSGDFANEPAMLISPARQTSARQVVLGAADTINCEIPYDKNKAQAIGLGADPPNWTDGSLTVSEVVTYYLDGTELKSFQDVNKNGVLDDGEASVLMDRIYDLQFAFGVDNNPDDGIVDNFRNGTDEWRFNAPIGGGTPLETYTHSDDGPALRQLGIGFLLGVPVRDQPPGIAQIFDGPFRGEYQSDGIYLRTTTSNAYLRNLLLFF
jgi:prepilin-type N-terminal cleavage/methylation domain-containing protein